MKILNLYAGIGGNRKLWGDEHEVTAVENVSDVAEVYQKLFPKDKVIVADAHQYLIDHHTEFDFIWSSPPCPTHSVTNHFLKGQGIFRYPDMKLWQEKKNKKENKQIVEVHVYIHNTNTNGAGGYIPPRCTCNDYKGNGPTSAPCPVHPNGQWNNITTC